MKEPRTDNPVFGLRAWLTPPALLVALMATAVSEAQPRDFMLCVINRDGSGLRNILPTPDPQTPVEESFRGINQPRWSPDGNQIVFDAVTDARGFEVMVIDVASSEMRALRPGLRPDWSPDGEQIAFKGYGSGRGGAWIMNADGSGSEEFIRHGDIEPKYSPDGRGLLCSLLYARDVKDQGIRFFDLRTGTTRHIDSTPPLSSQYVSWSPDAKWIVGVNADYLNQGYEPLFVSMDPEHPRSVTVSLAGDNHMCMSYAWSPDGKTILCAMMVIATMNSQEKSSSQIYWFDVPDLNQQSVTIHPIRLEGQEPDRLNSFPAWSPDGKRIVFTSFDPHNGD